MSCWFRGFGSFVYFERSSYFSSSCSPSSSSSFWASFRFLSSSRFFFLFPQLYRLARLRLGRFHARKRPRHVLLHLHVRVSSKLSQAILPPVLTPQAAQAAHVPVTQLAHPQHVLVDSVRSQALQRRVRPVDELLTSRPDHSLSVDRVIRVYR
jgi:hypothetical protein